MDRKGGGGDRCTGGSVVVTCDWAREGGAERVTRARGGGAEVARDWLGNGGLAPAGTRGWMIRRSCASCLKQHAAARERTYK